MEDDLEIIDMMDFIVVETFEGDTIKKDSRLLCGCCGKQLCRMYNDLTLPFSSDVLMKNIYDTSFKSALFGLIHETCGHTMFSFKKSWRFIPVENFKKMQNDK